MREIKFRAWDKTAKKFVDDFSLRENGDLQFYNEKTLKWVSMPKERYVLMQYTGLKDKNGKEIYKGDVVRHDYAKGEEFPSNGLMVVGSETPDGVRIVGFEMFDSRSSTTYSFDTTGEYDVDVEIIGNIYENPELLTPQP